MTVRDERPEAGHPGGRRRGHPGRRGRERALRLPRRPQAGRRARRLRAARPGGRRAAGAWTPARPPAASPTCCCARAPRRWSPSTSATASSPGRCRPTTGSTVQDRTNVRELDAGRRSTAAGRPRRRRPVLHPAAAWCCPPWCACVGAGRRPGADGQAAVRGGPGAAGQRRGRARARSCAPRRCARSPSGARRHRARACAGVTASPLPGPSGNVEYFLWLRAGAPRRWTRRDVDRAVRGGAAVTAADGRDRTVCPARRTPAAPRRIAQRRAGRRSGCCDAGIGVRVLARRGRGPGAAGGVERRRRRAGGAGRAASWSSCSAATARCCAAPSSPAPPGVPLLGRQPRPGRLPRRGRARRPRQGRRPGRRAATTRSRSG